MTVSSTSSRADYSGNGATVTFAVPFYFLDDAHLQVLRTNADGTVTTLVLTTDYTVTGAGVPAGGSVTCTSAPASGTRLSILRQVPAEQLTHYVPNDPFPAASHETALDKLTMLLQQVNEALTRTLTLPANLTTTATLPTPMASSFIGWNSTATALVNLDAAALVTSVTYGTTRIDTFTGNGAVGQQFVLSANPGSINNIQMFDNGTYLAPTDAFTWDSNLTVTLVGSVTNGHAVKVRYSQALPVGQVADNSITTAKFTSTAKAPFAGTADIAPWSGISGKPSTSAGYGIPDVTYAGDFKNSAQIADHGRWLLSDNRTIGDSTSGATARANADTLALFTVLWDGSANADLAIQDLTGAASTRGASAAADFAAHKRMPLPDFRGMVFKGTPNGGGTTTNTSRANLSYEADAVVNHSHSFNYRTLVGAGAGIVNSDGSSGALTPSQATTGGAAENLVRTRAANVFIYLGAA